jgi:DNA-binding NarL/FixJ family response regulator
MNSMIQTDEIRVIIIEDHPLMRLGVASIIGAQEDMTVVAEAGSGEEALELFRVYRPDVVVIDLGLPQMGGVAVIRALRLLNSDVKFVVLTTYEGDEDIYQALAAGAHAYVIKGLPHNMLVDAIRRVRRGANYVPPALMHKLDARSAAEKLSAQELRVLKMISEGRSNRNIGDELGVTEATIKYHVSEILGRLGAKDRTEAVVIAHRRGLLHL